MSKEYKLGLIILICSVIEIGVLLHIAFKI